MTRARELAKVSTAYETGGAFGHRNKIINGCMRFDQRNNGASVTPTGNDTYLLDRFVAELSQASKFSVQQNAGSVTPPVGFTNYLGVTSLSSYSVGSGDYFIISQRVEGSNITDLDFGKSTAKEITISFWVRSSLTGSFGGSVVNSDANRAYPFSYTISSANTWEKKLITLDGDTAGTWYTTNSSGLALRFSLGAGSTYSGTANAWAGSNYVAPTGSTSVVGTNGATWYMTGCQLEQGKIATPFEMRNYSLEDLTCKRYFGFVYVGADWESGTYSAHGITYPAMMRATPTFAPITNTLISNVSATDFTVGGFNSGNNLSGVVVQISKSGAGRAYQFAKYSVNAEI